MSKTLKIDSLHWHKAGQGLIEKMLAECFYEEVLSPEPFKQHFRVALGDLELDFRGYAYRLGHWHIEPGSVTVSGETNALCDFARVVTALCRSTGVSPFNQAYLMRELNNTQMADAHLLAQRQHDADELIDLPAQRIEGLLRGHPWIVMSKGRLGFGYQEYLQHAPENRRSRGLLWVAVHRDIARFSAVHDLSAERLYESELGSQWSSFQETVRQAGADPADYLFLPVHPWQWNNWLVPNYAAELTEGRIIELGETDDHYLPMQSIRTFSNDSRPERLNVKLPLTVLNTAVYRGLPPARNIAAPAVTNWLRQKADEDGYLWSAPLVMLGEVATVTVTQSPFADIEGAPYQFKELFGCLWRDSVHRHLNASEQVLSQAALVHCDANGASVLKALVRRSGLSHRAWLQKYFEVCVPPLLYWLYRYGVAFSAHGENSLLVHANGVPRKMVIKDFVDDINLVDAPWPELADLPDEAAVLNRLPAAELSHFIFTGLFVVHYRYLANIYIRDFGEAEWQFWDALATVVEQFHHDHPQLSDRARVFDLLRPAFEKVCLNRVRLFTQGYADDAERPVPAILGPMPNPISREVLDQWAAADASLAEGVLHA